MTKAAHKIKTPEQCAKDLINRKGIIEATFYVQNQLSECQNYTEEIFWTNVLTILRKAW